MLDTGDSAEISLPHRSSLLQRHSGGIFAQRRQDAEMSNGLRKRQDFGFRIWDCGMGEK